MVTILRAVKRESIIAIRPGIRYQHWFNRFKLPWSEVLSDFSQVVPIERRRKLFDSRPMMTGQVLVNRPGFAGGSISRNSAQA